MCSSLCMLRGGVLRLLKRGFLDPWDSRGNGCKYWCMEVEVRGVTAAP